MPRITLHGKVAYPHVVTPNTQGFRTGEFSARIYFPKTDTETHERVREAIDKAKQEKWGDKLPGAVKDPLKDGDKDNTNENWAGSYCLESHHKDKPLVVDRTKTPVTEELSNGCECNFVLDVCGYEVNGNLGVCCYLKAVQLINKGKWIGGSTRNILDLFECLDEDAE